MQYNTYWTSSTGPHMNAKKHPTIQGNLMTFQWLCDHLMGCCALWNKMQWRNPNKFYPTDENHPWLIISGPGVIIWYGFLISTVFAFLFARRWCSVWRMWLLRSGHSASKQPSHHRLSKRSDIRASQPGTVWKCLKGWHLLISLLPTDDSTPLNLEVHLTCC